MATDITEVITARLKTMGMSQAQFAECISATPAQVGIFLKKQGSLSIDAINKSFDLIGVNVGMYSKRIEFAQKVAEILKRKSISNIEAWTQDDLVNFTQLKEIKQFFNIQKQEDYLDILSSGLVDYESTFPYFKSLVAYFLNIDDSSVTSSSAKNALYKLMDHQTDDNVLAKRTLATMAIGTMAFSILPAVSAAAAVAMTTCKQVGAFSLFSSTMKDSLFAKSIDYLISKNK